MTSLTRRRSLAGLAFTATWHNNAADLPPVDAAYPFTTRAWAQAWDQAAPEDVRARRHLHLQTTASSEAVSYRLVGRDPFWNRLQMESGVTVPWTGPVLYCGTLYGEYGGAGGATAQTLGYTVDTGIALARAWGAAALLVPNLPPSSAAAWNLERPADATVFTDMAFTAGVDGGMQTYLDAFPRRSVARDMLRQHRRAIEAGLVVQALNGDHMLPHLDAFALLADATTAKHRTPLYHRALWPALARVPGAILLAAFHQGRLVGGFFSFHHNGRLHAWAAGIDADRQRSLHTYTALMVESAQLAIRLGARTLDAGWSNVTYKQRHGLTGAPLHSLVYLTRPHKQTTDALTAMGDSLQIRATAAPRYARAAA